MSESSGWQKVHAAMKSLRTGKIGEQCEAIVKLPDTFEEYPFPILVNTAFLKVAEIFRTCNDNFIRLCILRITLQSTNHHNKITGKDEFLRPILSVTNSNDAVARAITLRVLGATASIFFDKKNVYHSIVRGLESYVRAEKEAAIYACAKYASISQDVSKAIVSKLEELMNCLSTHTSLKIKILSIFQTMKYDYDTAQQVRSLCLDIIEHQNSEPFVKSCLQILTNITLTTLSNPRELVDLLFKLGESEPRQVLRVTAFSCLCQLAQYQHSIFTAEDVVVLRSVADKDVTPLAAQVLLNLSRNRSNLLLGGDTFNMLSSKIESSPLHSAVLIFECCCNLLSKSGDTQDSLIFQFHPLLMKCLLEKKSPLLKRLLASHQKLTSLPNSNITPTISLLFGVLLTTEQSTFCQISYALSSLKSHFNTDLHSADTMDLVLQLGRFCDTKKLFSCKLLLSLYHAKHSSPAHMFFTEHIKPPIEGIISTMDDNWPLYCLARVALHNGHHSIASVIFSRLKKEQLTEFTRAYFTGLDSVCEAEVVLEGKELSDVLMQALITYKKAVTSLSCSSTKSNIQITSFQVAYIKLRISLIEIFLQLINVISLDNLYGSDSIEQYLPTLAFISSRIDLLLGDIDKVMMRMFDASERCVSAVDDVKCMCQLLKTFCLAKEEVRKFEGDTLTVVECNRIISILGSNPVAKTSLTFLKQLLVNLIKVPFIIPKFFFIQPSPTTIDLATTPVIEEGVIRVAASCNLILIVEGVLRGYKRGKVSKVLVNISCDIQSLNSNNKFGVSRGEEVSLSQKEVKVENDYFKVELCLDVVMDAQLFMIRAVIIDQDDVKWNIDSELSFKIKIDNSLVKMTPSGY